VDVNFSGVFFLNHFFAFFAFFAVDFEVLKKMNLFVFDIETVPDVESGRRLYGLDRQDERNAAAAMFRLRAQETGGSEFLHHHLHRVVAISDV